MGEAPRARITAQNTLTTWHDDRLYGAMVIEVIFIDFKPRSTRRNPPNVEQL